MSGLTTPVNYLPTDILDALEQNPALREQLRSYILTEELLQLPAQFVLLRADVDELNSQPSPKLEEGQSRLEDQPVSSRGDQWTALERGPVPPRGGEWTDHWIG